MKQTYVILAFCCILAWMLASCKKTESIGHTPPPDTDITSNDPPAYYNYPSGAGLFMVSTITTNQNYNSGYGYICGHNTQVQTYPNNTGSPMTYGKCYALSPLSLNFDSVNFQGHRMFEDGCSYKTYRYGPSDSIDLISPAVWSFKTLTGSNVDSSYNDTTSPPKISGISVADTISLNANFTLRSSGQVIGDSVIFLIKGSNAYLIKTLSRNADTCLFSSIEMSKLKATAGNIYIGQNAGLVQIIPFTMRQHLIDGANCYFMKEACYSKYVVLR